MRQASLVLVDMFESGRRPSRTAGVFRQSWLQTLWRGVRRGQLRIPAASNTQLIACFRIYHLRPLYASILAIELQLPSLQMFKTSLVSRLPAACVQDSGPGESAYPKGISCRVDHHVLALVANQRVAASPLPTNDRASGVNHYYFASLFSSSSRLLLSLFLHLAALIYFATVLLTTSVFLVSIAIQKCEPVNSKATHSHPAALQERSSKTGSILWELCCQYHFWEGKRCLSGASGADVDSTLSFTMMFLNRPRLFVNLFLTFKPLLEYLVRTSSFRRSDQDGCEHFRTSFPRFDVDRGRRGNHSCSICYDSRVRLSTMPRFSLGRLRRRLGPTQDEAERSGSEPQMRTLRDPPREGTRPHLPGNDSSAGSSRDRADRAKTTWTCHLNTSRQWPARRPTPPPRPEHRPGFYPEDRPESDDSEATSSAGHGPGSAPTSTQEPQRQAEAYGRGPYPRPKLEVEIPKPSRPAPIGVPPSDQTESQPSYTGPFVLDTEMRESWTEFLAQSAGSYNRVSKRRPYGRSYSYGDDPESPAPSSPDPLESMPGPSRPIQRRRGSLADESVTFGRAAAMTISKPGQPQLVDIERSDGDSGGEEDSPDSISDYSGNEMVLSEENSIMTPGTPPSAEDYNVLVRKHGE